MNSGKWVIAGIMGLALVAASAAWWNAWSKGRRALEYWGSEAAYLIRLAPTVTLIELQSPPELATDQQSGKQWPGLVNGQDYTVKRRLDISQARGLVHARQALIQDTSYQWPVMSSPAVNWQYAIEFVDQQRRVVVLLNLDSGIVARLDHAGALNSTLAPGFKILLEDFTHDLGSGG